MKYNFFLSLRTLMGTLIKFIFLVFILSGDKQGECVGDYSIT